MKPQPNRKSMFDDFIMLDSSEKRIALSQSDETGSNRLKKRKLSMKERNTMYS